MANVVLTKEETATLKAAGEIISLKLTEAGDRIIVRGFGTFKVDHREERVARNPKTGEEVLVPAKDVLKFSDNRGGKNN